MTAPEVPHADLIAENERATTTADEWLAAHKVTESWRIVNRLRDQLVRMADALAALGDTVPREQHERHLAANRWPMAQLREVRAERDALAHVIEQMPHADECGRDSFRRWPCDCWKSTAPAVSLALHDAEVWWQGVTAQWEHRPVGNRLLESRNPYLVAPADPGAR